MTGKAYQRISLGKTSTGKPLVVNRRTAAMLREAERRLGTDLRIFQGSYNAGVVAASGGTHDGGGAVDVWPANGRVDDTVRVLRKVGFAAWHRTPTQGPWGHHIHAVSVDDAEKAPSAARQVADYRKGLNGLANRGKDDGPRVRIRPWALVRRILAVKFATAELERWRLAHQS